MTLHHWNPKYIISDFESGLIDVVKSQFQNAMYTIRPVNSRWFGPTKKNSHVDESVVDDSACSRHYLHHLMVIVVVNTGWPATWKVREFHCWSGKMNNVTNLHIISALFQWWKGSCMLKPAFEFCLCWML